MRSPAPRRASRTRAVLGLAAALATSGCAHLPWSRAAHCPVALVPTSALPDLLLRERIRFAPPGEAADASAQGDARKRVDVVVEKRGDALTLVGLTPAGTRAFSVVQHGMHVEVDRGVSRWLGVDPEQVLDAVQRARLVGFDEAPAPDGEHAAWQGSEERTDSWRGGRLVARRYAAPGSPPAVRIEYRPGEEEPLIAIENDWCGYSARIVTLSEERLP